MKCYLESFISMLQKVQSKVCKMDDLIVKCDWLNTFDSSNLRVWFGNLVFEYAINIQPIFVKGIFCL